MTTHVLNAVIYIVCVCVCVCSWTNIHIYELKWNHKIVVTSVRVRIVKL